MTRASACQHMAGSSRLQINFERLLHVCEKQAATDHEDHWRLQKFVEDLQQKLVLLNKESCNKAHPEVLKDFQKRVELLKGVISAEKLSSPTEKLKAAQSLPVPKTASLPANNRRETQVSHSKEILLHTKAKFSNESRRALLGDRGDGLRKRGGDGPQSDSDLDSILQHHQQVQEKLAEDMVSLARNMKDHAKAAKQIVQDDNKKLQETTKLADSNYTQLKVESSRLEEHTKKSSCWMVLLFVFVLLVFVWTVIFMKLFPKPKT